MTDALTLAAGLPKWLGLNNEDVDAVRSFLPGKVLGRTAALLALVVLVLGVAGSLDVASERFLGTRLEPPFLRYTALIGLPVIIVGAQILAEWVADRKRREAQALAVKVEAVPEGFFRIGPYLDTAEDRAKFDRADRIHEKVLDWIKLADAMPLYLTGNSGSGKSSVLNAYALPELRQAGWTVVEARAWQNPEQALSEGIVKLANARKLDLGEAKSLRSMLEALVKYADEKLLLVLDQFEEFVILRQLAGSERQSAFAALVDDLRVKPVKGLTLLLVLRSDYQAALDELGLPPQRKWENWAEVGRFTVAAGAKFVARSGLALQADALDEVVTSASELDDSKGMVRPITLNVVGYVLSQGRSTAPSLDAGRLVSGYIEQSVEQPAIRAFAPKVLSELVTAEGTKWPRSEKDLVDKTGLRQGEVRAVMNGLSAAALARSLDSAQGVWELSHDFVARGVARYLGRRRLDVRGIVHGYAAPALFVLMAAGSAGAIAWNANAADRARVRLAELGIVANSSAGGLAAKPDDRFETKDLARVAGALSDLTNLRSLDLSHTQITDLAPIKDLKTLQVLYLPRTRTTNLAPLKGLISLQSLNLPNTRVADLEPIKDLTALRSLDLSDTQVVDIGPLKELKALERLDLTRTRVADLAPVKDLTALRSLGLSDTQVVDIGPLKELKSLQKLDLTRTQVADLASLNDLTALHSLDLSDTQVVDIGPLRELKALQKLDLTRTQVADLAPLRDLTALRSLDLSNTQVVDIGPLEEFKALQELRLTRTQVEDLGPLKDLKALKSLDLMGTQIANIEPLKELKALQMLNLSNTEVGELRPLEDLTALRSLDLSDTQVVDIEPLKGLTKLQSLSLAKTRAVDLGPLEDVTELQSLDLSHTQVADLGPIKKLKALQYSLDLSGTQVASIEPIKELKALESVDLSGTKVADLGPLKDLTALRSLNLSNTQVVDIGPIKEFKALETLDLMGTQITNIESLKELTALQELYLLGTKIADLTPARDLTELRTICGVPFERLRKVNAYRAHEGLSGLLGVPH